MFTGPKGDVEGEEKGRRGGRLLDVEMRRDEMTEERSRWKLLLAKGKGNDKIRGISGYQRRHSITAGIYTRAYREPTASHYR